MWANTGRYGDTAPISAEKTSAVFSVATSKPVAECSETLNPKHFLQASDEIKWRLSRPSLVMGKQDWTLTRGGHFLHPATDAFPLICLVCHCFVELRIKMSLWAVNRQQKLRLHRRVLFTSCCCCVSVKAFYLSNGNTLVLPLLICTHTHIMQCRVGGNNQRGKTHITSALNLEHLQCLFFINAIAPIHQYPHGISILSLIERRRDQRVAPQQQEHVRSGQGRARRSLCI